MKAKQKWVGLGLATVMGLSSILPVAESALVVQAKTSLPFNKEVVERYAEVEPLVTAAEASKSVKDVEKAYLAFISMSQLFILDDQRVYIEGNDMDKLYERISKLVYSLPKAEQKKHLPKMADKWVEAVKNNSATLMKFYLEDFLRGNKNKEVSKAFDESIRKMNFYQTMPPGTPLPSDWKKPVKDQVKEQEKTNKKPVLNNPNKPNKVTTPKPEKGANATRPSAQQKVEFIQVGKFWYEVTVSYKDGKINKTERRKLSEKEAPHLYQVTATTGNDALAGGAKGSLFPELTDSEKAYLTEDQNETSKYTIQYSLDKQADSPYYFDTGLRVDEKMKASYEQYRDVLYQIAVKSGGYVVEDSGRVLIVIDKKAIIVEDAKKSFSEKEIESLFESFPNIDIRVLETRIGTSTSLEQQLVSKQARTVWVSDVKVDLESTPIVRDDRVLLPIKELVKAMDAKLEQKGDQFIVTKGKDTVVYELKSTKVVVKGKEVDIEIAPDVKNNVLYVEMSELATAFNYEMVWDGDASELTFHEKVEEKGKDKPKKKAKTTTMKPE